MVVLAATLVAVFFADRQRALYEEENSRNMVTEQLSVMRSEIEGRINGNIFLLKGLVAVLEAEPDMPPDRFHELARKASSQAGNVAMVLAAPDMVVTMAYPQSAAGKVGFDFRKRNREHGAAFLAAQSRKVNVSGPVDLPDGGKGLVVNYPVLVDVGKARPDLWGIVSATIDLDGLFAESGLTAEDLPLTVAISRTDVNGEATRPFFGSPEALLHDPVGMTVSLGKDYWLMAALPKNGWQVGASALLTFRLLLLLVASAILVPVIWSIRLMGERNRSLDEMQANGERLLAVSRRLEIALDTSRVGIWEHDINNDRQIWDERVREHFGITEEKPFYSFADWEAIVHPEDLDRANADYQLAVISGQPYTGQYRIISAKTGEIRHIRAFGRLIDATPGQERMLGVDWDITADVKREEALRAARQIAESQNREIEEARRQMEYNSLHDALTGLPNRRYLDQVIAERRATGAVGDPLAVLHMDLDRFKDINDTLGHAAGDNILRHAANVLSACTRPGDFVARIGGDEFVILPVRGRRPEELEALANNLIQALSEPVLFEGQECRAGASIGIAIQASREESADMLLVNADIALYEAKKRGRGRVEFFTDTLRAQVIQTKQLADEILRALEQGEFTAFFQPQFNARTRAIDGVEALVRWEHPERGLVMPDQFLKVAESLNVMQRIDEIVLDQALFHYHQWQAAGIDIPRVSVNISAQRLLDSRLVEKIEALRIVPGSLCFELLESISFEDQDKTMIETIDALKSLGVDMEIDDFGTGHASIVNLLKLTPKRLKIDRQLIQPILTSPKERQLVSSIIDIGRTCGIEIVAEGVETMAHAAVLRDMGAHTLQGYAFARPMRASELIAFARARARADEQDALLLA
jgi:diguanylate cyclase (GGDEF)-like protein